MDGKQQSFTIRASASRLGKGLLAIPQRFRDWFPSSQGQIQVVFDDEEKSVGLTFHPYDSVTKETRIFGLARWFSRRGVQQGDLISITLEGPRGQRYRIALERYVRQRREENSRQKLRAAQTDLEAQQELITLSEITRKRPRQLARQELIRIAEESSGQPRPRVAVGISQRREDVPSATRILLRELHDGRCQICSFTFKKRNGEPYFEIHHLDPKIGHHPKNLLVICANCHAQFEHATIADHEYAGGWLVGVTINGKRTTIRQPFVQDSIGRTVLLLGIIVAASQFSRLLLPLRPFSFR